MLRRPEVTFELTEVTVILFVRAIWPNRIGLQGGIVEVIAKDKDFWSSRDAVARETLKFIR